jgi:hypothetical protein
MARTLNVSYSKLHLKGFDMRRIVAALFLATFASAPFAQPVDTSSGRTHVNNPQECPAGTTPSAYYEWHGGRFAQEGWVCQRVPSPV